VSTSATRPWCEKSGDVREYFLVQEFDRSSVNVHRQLGEEELEEIEEEHHDEFFE
jgi:hypothetical protein